MNPQEKSQPIETKQKIKSDIIDFLINLLKDFNDYFEKNVPLAHHKEYYDMQNLHKSISGLTTVCQNIDPTKEIWEPLGAYHNIDIQNKDNEKIVYFENQIEKLVKILIENNLLELEKDLIS